MVQATWLRVLLLGFLINVHQYFIRLVDKIVPEPYLDEIFHIPQAQKYWLGKWKDWDPKITTPPGVYLWSYLFNSVRGGRGNDLTAEDLRFSNAVLLYLLVVVLTVWTAIARQQIDTTAVLQREFVIVAFPLLFFFSGLYYTDLFSALTVVLACIAWEAGTRFQRRRWIFRFLHLIFGLLSLASRQTNVFWVAVFLAGMQVVDTVSRQVGSSAIHNPNVAEACVEDFFHFAFSLLRNIFSAMPQLFLDLLPQVTLLLSFAGFVIWNDGVVLGDKQNHVATIHTPQLLYIWPMIVFFSWPAILSSLAAQSQSQPFTIATLRSRLPRPWVAILVMALMATSVHFNTIVHPFTLADNRHYPFYIFRILTRQPWIKYAAVPVYFVCAWIVFTALGHAVPNNDSISRTDEGTSNQVSFMLIWLASTALSLVTAPLVEPRYFIVPWLIWRMHVPEPTTINLTETNTSKSTKKNVSKPNDKDKDSAKGKTAGTVAGARHLLISYALWLELAWYAVVNTATIYVFLQWGFKWPQEPGNIQRFMW